MPLRIRWQPVWGPDNRRPRACVTRFKPWVRRLLGAVGVYVIRCANCKRALYVGQSSSDLGKRIQRHFRPPAAGKRETHPPIDRARVEAFALEIAPARLRAVEARFIARYRPKYNQRQERVAIADSAAMETGLF